jgi:cutinase
VPTMTASAIIARVMTSMTRKIRISAGDPGDQRAVGDAFLHPLALATEPTMKMCAFPSGVPLTADNCPHTRLVPGGFSPGASLVSMPAGIDPVDNRIGSTGWAPPPDPPLAGNVSAVAVFDHQGNPFDTALSATGQFADRAIDLCSQGDPICSDGGDRSAHSHYETPPHPRPGRRTPGQAAGFIAGRV